MPSNRHKINDWDYYAYNDQYSTPHDELNDQRFDSSSYRAAPSGKKRRKAKKHHGFRNLVLLLLLAVGLYYGVKYYGGDFLPPGILGIFSKSETSGSTENIKLDYLIDVSALDGELPAVSTGFSPSEDDLYLLQRAREQNPELEGKFDLFTRHIDSFSRTAIRTLYLSPEKMDYILQDPLHMGEESGDSSPIEVKKGSIPFLVQYDSRWGNHLYGSGGMGNTGCGPTCLSMVAAGLTGNADYTPPAVADYAAENGYYVEGTGTSWSLFTDGAAGLGLRGWELPLDEDSVREVLRRDGAVILSVTQGDFTFAGHFIVVSDYKNGQFTICDPSSVKRSSQLWDGKSLLSQSVAAWGFSA